MRVPLPAADPLFSQRVRRPSLTAMRPRNVLLSLLTVLTGLCSGCSFSREWKEASRQAPPAGDITGAWVGTWQNTNNDHKDRLKAVITRVSDTEYTARFKAWWLGIFSGTFDATLSGRWEDGEYVFSGTQKVMSWEFSQQGRINPTNFVSEYSSEDYRGNFTLHRTEPEAK